MSALKGIQVPAAFNTAGLNIVWILVGLIAIYAGIKNLLDEENPSRIGTAIFWCSFGIVTALGTWLPAKVSGVLVIICLLYTSPSPRDVEHTPKHSLRRLE